MRASAPGSGAHDIPAEPEAGCRCPAGGSEYSLARSDAVCPSVAPAGMFGWIDVESLVGDAYSCMGMRSRHGHPDDDARTVDARAPTAFDAGAPKESASASQRTAEPFAALRAKSSEPFGALRSKPPYAEVPAPLEPMGTMRRARASEPFAALRKDVPSGQDIMRGVSSGRTSDASNTSDGSTPNNGGRRAVAAKVSPLVGAMSAPGAFEFTLPHSRGWQGVLKSLIDQQLRLAGITPEDFNIHRLVVTDFKGVHLNVFSGEFPDRDRFPLLVKYGDM